MTEPVRVVDGWTVGGGGRLRELWRPGAPVILAGRLTRWLFRHPAAVAVIAAGAAAAVRWGSLLAGALAAAAVAILACAGWLAWVSRRGSAANLRQILSGVARTWRVRRRWRATCGHAGLTERGRAAAVPPLRDVRITPTGLTAVAVPGAIGRHAREVAKASDVIAASMFCDRVIVRQLSPSACVVRWDWGRHLSATFRLHELPAPTSSNRIVYGVREDGTGAELVANLSTLIVGVSGSGKSSAAWAILAGYLKAGIPIRVRVIDPGQIEFDALRRALEAGGSTIAHQYVRDFRDLKGLWGNIDRALDARLASVITTGRREHVPTLEEPLDITIVDELLPIAGDLRREGVQHTLGRVAYLGRKAGFVTIALSQAGKVSAIGDVRDLFPQRLAFRTPNRFVTDAALGDGASADGARCQDLDVDHDRGVCYSVQDGIPGYSAARAAWVPDVETKAIAAGRVPTRPGDLRAQLEARETSLYRLYDVDDVLLYVGIAVDLEQRMSQHAADKPWWGKVERRTVEAYPNRLLAETAEARAIQRERPLHNLTHNGGRA